MAAKIVTLKDYPGWFAKRTPTDPDWWEVSYQGRVVGAVRGNAIDARASIRSSAKLRSDG